MSTQGIAEGQLLPAEPASEVQGPKNPWWIVIAMVCGLMVGAGTVIHYALGPLIKQLSADYGWSRGTVSGGISCAFIGASISFVSFGILVDRWGPRPAGLLSVALMVVPLLLMTQISEPWHFYLAMLAFGTFAGGATATPYIKAIAARFEQRRGLAMGIGAAGVGLGGILVPQYMNYVMEHHGWRPAIVGMAVIVVAVSVPALWFGLAGVKAAPREPKPAAGAAPAFSLWRSRSYLIIAGSIALVSFAINGIVVHAVALLTDRGVSAGHAATAMSGVAVMSTIARVVGGYLMDRFFAPLVTAILFLLVAVGVTLLIVGGTGVTAFAGLLLVGFTLGAEVDAMNYLISRYCPINVVGKAIGVTFAIFTLSGSAAVWVLGKGHDMFDSYVIPLIFASILAVLSAFLVSRLGPYTNEARGH
ncbi:MAG: major facilitator superfamily 1 [Alphaproteobacteria bacterium]|nr:major facilitator superfamily 1 [Alphaproteobacteria bacterium]